MGAFLIDTNAVIEFLGGILPVTAGEWLQNIIDQNQHRLSVINQIELLGFNGHVDEMQMVKDFVSSSQVIALSEPIVRQTIKLRKSRKIGLPDAIIAATALVHELPVITRNISDFKKIENVKCINPHEQ